MESSFQTIEFLQGGHEQLRARPPCRGPLDLSERQLSPVPWRELDYLIVQAHTHGALARI